VPASSELGDAAAFSFYPTKNLGCAGDGGALVTRDERLAAALRLLRDHGMPAKYEHAVVGTNSRLHALQAALLRVKLTRLEAWNERRRRIAALYDEAFAEDERVRPLGSAPGSRPVYHQYTVRLVGVDRERVRARLSERGIATAVHYPSPVHLQPAARSFGFAPGSLPVAERLAREVLCLPVHPFLRDRDAERVAVALLEEVRAGGAEERRPGS
jgi:dTDP-4-amino-4,6-dideoxygalactose transaminase